MVCTIGNLLLCSNSIYSYRCESCLINLPTEHDGNSQEKITLYNVCSVHRGMFSTSGGVQYIGGIPWVHRGDIMSTSGGYHDERGGIPWVHRGMFSTSEGYHEYIGGYHEYIGGYHEYIGGCSVHRRDIMIHVEEQLDKILSISIENSDVLNIPRCTEHPPMYSWYPPDVLMISPDVLMVSPWCTEHPPCTHGIPPTCIMISPDILNIPRCTHDIPRCTHGIPPMYWTPPDVLMVSPRCTHGIPPMYWTPPDVLMISPDVLMVSPRCTHGIPRCTHGIPPMYSWYPPMYWTPPMYSWYPSDVLNTPDVLMISPDVLMVSPRCTHGISPMYSWYPPDVLNTPRCTEHPPMYWTHIIQGENLDAAVQLGCDEWRIKQLESPFTKLWQVFIQFDLFRVQWMALQCNFFYQIFARSVWSFYLEQQSYLFTPSQFSAWKQHFQKTWA